MKFSINICAAGTKKLFQYDLGRMNSTNTYLAKGLCLVKTVSSLISITFALSWMKTISILQVKRKARLIFLLKLVRYLTKTIFYRSQHQSKRDTLYLGLTTMQLFKMALPLDLAKSANLMQVFAKSSVVDSLWFQGKGFNGKSLMNQ